MGNIVNYTAGKCSEAANKIVKDLQKRNCDRREKLEQLDRQVAEGNVFAARYRDSLLDEREDALLRSAELLRDSLDALQKKTPEHPGFYYEIYAIHAILSIAVATVIASLMDLIAI